MASTPVSAPGSTFASNFASFTFSHQITILLDEKNFNCWKQQIEEVLQGHILHRFLVNHVIPLKYLTEEDRVADNVNPLYSEWEQQDSLLFTWLLSSLLRYCLMWLHVFIPDKCGNNFTASSMNSPKYNLVFFAQN